MSVRSKLGIFHATKPDVGRRCHTAEGLSKMDYSRFIEDFGTN